jgi:HEAT repeat protein
MKNLKKTTLFPLLLVIILTLTNLYGATQILDYSNVEGTLQDKWNNTVTTSLKQNKHFWIAYSIERIMPENKYYIANKNFSGILETGSFTEWFPKLKGTPLGTLIYGNSFKIIKPYERSDKMQLKSGPKQEHKRPQYKKIKKEVAILFLFNAGNGKVPVKLKHSNMSFPFGNKGLPIYWLGKSDESKSVQLLASIFNGITNEDSKKYLISSLGGHSNSLEVIPFLVKVINSNESDALRGKCISKLGNHDNPGVTTILLNTAKTDHSLDVRRKAVTTLKNQEFPSATDALIDIANGANNIYIRQNAIASLGEKGTKKAALALKDIAFSTTDIDSQVRAVNALKYLPQKGGILYIIDIAKTHHIPRIRKKALGILKHIKDPRAFEAIKAIARGK